MKNFLRFGIVALFSMSSIAMASSIEPLSEVILDQKHISIDAPTATLVRTANTPKVVKIEMQVPVGHTVCEETGTRIVFGRNPVCGYDTVYRTVYRSYCVRYERTNPHSRRCVQWERRREIYPVSVMRACHYPISYCVRYGTATRFETRELTLVFRKATKLGADEKETFALVAEQTGVDSNDVDFTLSSLSSKQPYAIRSSDLFGDRIKVVKIDQSGDSQSVLGSPSHDSEFQQQDEIYIGR